jgi:hypothetical protein
MSAATTATIPGMRAWSVVLLGASVALATSACESGWGLEGHVITDAVADKSGSLHVYVVDEPTIDIAAVQMASPSIFYWDQDATQPIPEAGYDFGVHQLGCHEGAVAIVAWAPAAPLPPEVNHRLPFAPRSGDYVAFSDVRHPYCGHAVHTDHVELTLTLRP